jgi:hypothetical protein
MGNIVGRIILRRSKQDVPTSLQLAASLFIQPMGADVEELYVGDLIQPNWSPKSTFVNASTKPDCQLRSAASAPNVGNHTLSANQACGRPFAIDYKSTARTRVAESTIIHPTRELNAVAYRRGTTACDQHQSNRKPYVSGNQIRFVSKSM